MNLSQASPIGVFDSGIGGLTVARGIAPLLPHEQIIYFGDIAHLPYGDKSAEAIQQYSLSITNFLLEKNCKAIVIACNTASSVAYHLLEKQINGRALLIDVIDPVVSMVVASDIQKVGVIATKRTTQTDIYPKKLTLQKADLEIVAKATHSFVSIIEEGIFANSKVMKALIEHYLCDENFADIEGLILGCTHYPIIKEAIAEYYQHKVQIFDSTECVANALQNLLSKNDLLNTGKRKQHEFYVSDYTEAFEQMTEVFFQKPISLSKVQLVGELI